MAKVIKYGDFTKVEATGFKPAPVGLYYAKVESIKQTTSQKNNEEMVEVVFRLTKDSDGKKLKEQYGQLWYYAPLDPNSSWARRFKELVTAFGLKPKSGNVAVIEGKEAMVRLREDTDLNGGYRPTIGKVIALPDEAEAEEEDEEDEAEDSNGLADLSRAELKKLIKDEELEVRVTKSMSDDDLRAAIAEVREDEEEDEEEEEEPEDEADEDEEDDDESEDEDEEESDNYEAMSVAELRQELKDRELATNGKRTVLIARLRTDDVEEPV